MCYRVQCCMLAVWHVAKCWPVDVLMRPTAVAVVSAQQLCHSLVYGSSDCDDSQQPLLYLKESYICRVDAGCQSSGVKQQQWGWQGGHVHHHPPYPASPHLQRAGYPLACPKPSSRTVVTCQLFCRWNFKTETTRYTKFRLAFVQS